MIQAYDKGNGVQIIINTDGIVETIEELVAIIRGVKHHLTDLTEEDFADTAIAYAGKMAYAETDEDRHKHTDEFCKWLEGEDKVGD